MDMRLNGIGYFRSKKLSLIKKDKPKKPRKKSRIYKLSPQLTVSPKNYTPIDARQVHNWYTPRFVSHRKALSSVSTNDTEQFSSIEKYKSNSVHLQDQNAVATPSTIKEESNNFSELIDESISSYLNQELSPTESCDTPAVSKHFSSTTPFAHVSFTPESFSFVKSVSSSTRRNQEYTARELEPIQCETPTIPTVKDSKPEEIKVLPNIKPAKQKEQFTPYPIKPTSNSPKNIIDRTKARAKYFKDKKRQEILNHNLYFRLN